MKVSATTNEPGSAVSFVTQPADGVSLPNSCGRCSTRWAGSNAAHCAGCHRTFSSPSTFDAHRIRNTAAGGCLDPAKVGMVEHRRAGYAVWGFPGDEAATERLKALRAGTDPRGSA